VTQGSKGQRQGAAEKARGKPRRGRGEGGVRKRADGRWEAIIDLGWSGGQRRRKSVYGRTRNEVVGKLRRLQNDIDLGRPVMDERVRLESFLATWLTEVVLPRRSHGHWRNCDSHVRLHITPAIGRVPLTRLTGADVEHLVNEVRAKGLSDNTVRLVHATIRAALGVAKRWGLVHDNVATLVEPVKVEREEVVPFDDEEVGRLLDAAAEDRMGAYLKVALALALRPGEGRALKWEDLDLDGPQPALRVHRAFSRSDNGEQLGPPKTARSRRTIALPKQLVPNLREHHRRQLEERLVAGPAWEELGFVFTNHVGAPLTESTLARWFARLCDRANVPRHRIYDCRHTAASLLLAQGIHPRVLMEVLGHSTFRLTMDTYSHVMPAAMRDAADAMDAALTRVLRKSDGTPVGGQLGGQAPPK